MRGASSSRFGKVLLCAGAILFLHSVYSAVHYKGLDVTAAANTSDDWIPFDIKAELFIAFFVTLIGALASAGAMLEVKSSTHLATQTWDEFLDDPVFRLYNHRAGQMRRVAAQRK